VTDPLTTLFHLTDEIENLDEVQAQINHARGAAPRNQHVQLQLDRQQAEVDRNRFIIASIMADIRNRN